MLEIRALEVRGRIECLRLGWRSVWLPKVSGRRDRMIGSTCSGNIGAVYSSRVKGTVKWEKRIFQCEYTGSCKTGVRDFIELGYSGKYETIDQRKIEIWIWRVLISNIHNVKYFIDVILYRDKILSFSPNKLYILQTMTKSDWNKTCSISYSFAIIELKPNL